MPRPIDPTKQALADFIVDAIVFATEMRQGQTQLAPHLEPLEDFRMSTFRISDLELDIHLNGNGQTRFFAVKLSEDRQ